MCTSDGNGVSFLIFYNTFRTHDCVCHVHTAIRPLIIFCNMPFWPKNYVSLSCYPVGLKFAFHAMIFLSDPVNRARVPRGKSSKTSNCVRG